MSGNTYAPTSAQAKHYQSALVGLLTASDFPAPIAIALGSAAAFLGEVARHLDDGFRRNSKTKALPAETVNAGHGE